MKSDKDKKYQAALAGVMMYIEEEMANNAKSEVEKPNQPDYWAHYGKQTIMYNRGMMQMKLRKR